MKLKFYSALLAFGVAISAQTKAGTFDYATPTNIELVMDGGFTMPNLHLCLPRYRDREWDPLSASTLAAQRAAIDLSMTTPGLFPDLPVGPAAFFAVVVRFTPDYHRGSTTAVVFTDTCE